MTTQATEGPAVTQQPRTLADLRKAAGLTSVQVGQRMGINGQRVRHIEAKYPNIRYDTLARYIQAIGGSIQFTVGTTHTHADRLIPDPEMAGTRKYLSEKASETGVKRLNAGALPEELPLQGSQAQPGDNDTGRQVDHADAESDQGDSGQREQP